MNTERCVKCDYCDLEDFFWDGKRLCLLYRCRIYRDTIQKAAAKCPYHLKANKPMEDMIRHPDHYTWKGVECIKLIEIMTRGMSGIEAYYMGNVIKYLFRYLKKNGAEDLDKAIQYTTMLREYRYGKKQEVKPPDGAGELPKENQICPGMQL